MAQIDLANRGLFYGTEAERLSMLPVEGMTFLVTDIPGILKEYTGTGTNLGDWELIRATVSGSGLMSLRLGGPPKGPSERIVNLSSVVTLNPPAQATSAVIQAEAQNVRFYDDGSNPTASAGFLIYAAVGGEFPYSGDLSSVKLIEATAGAIVNVLYY